MAIAQQAHQYVREQVFEPIFWRKMAEYGRPMPASAEDRYKTMLLGERLYAQHQNELVKQAAAQNTILDYALTQVDQMSGAGDHAEDDWCKSAGVYAVQQDQTLAQASMLLAAAYAQAQ
jgi:hypothetical protein